jgi:DNA invertase Pin-like site-specific DNA recombinase
MLVGYARTSSLAQVAGLEAQKRELRAAGCNKIFREQVSSVAQREQLEQALGYVREGDIFTVTKLDRLVRSVGNLLGIAARLEDKKVLLRVLSMSGSQPLDTGTAMGRSMLAVIGAVGQAEREAMLERQRRGIDQSQGAGSLQGRRADCSAAGCRQKSSVSRRQTSGPRKSPAGWRLDGPASIECLARRLAARDIERAPNGAR